MTTQLPLPTLDDAADWVEAHLTGLYSGSAVRSRRFSGGQTAADQALETFDVAGYASQRNEVLPQARRGASGLSPYIRHGLLSLPRVWNAVASGPSRDVAKFRDELLWQEYARHLYARIGTAMQQPLRFATLESYSERDPWPAEMACVQEMVAELEEDGWLVNQARMWLASQWSVRAAAEWRHGEDRFFTHLLDGSRAANRLGWQWTAGLQTGKAYGFSRSQVERRAPELCRRCPLASSCPIDDWPDPPTLVPLEVHPALSLDEDISRTRGPLEPEAVDQPDVVWLTAESLGDADPALAAHPDLPAVFVFDAPLLRRLQLSGKRLVFLAEALADLATRRNVLIYRDTPAEAVAQHRPAVTFAPVPGFRRIAAQIEIAQLHPWPWLRQPHVGPIQSFSAWRKRLA